MDRNTTRSRPRNRVRRFQHGLNKGSDSSPGVAASTRLRYQVRYGESVNRRRPSAHPNRPRVGNRHSNLPEGDETTERRTTTRNGIVRNKELVRKLKQLYDDTCQVCGDRRQQGPSDGFSHVHHLMPLGAPHDGPDIPENVIVVCPNHHEDVEHGILTLNPHTCRIDHDYEDDVTGRALETTGDHELAAEYVTYHNAVIAHTD